MKEIYAILRRQQQQPDMKDQITDIVARLRKLAPDPLAYGEQEAFAMNERDRHDGADEIERLRAALEALTGRLGGSDD